MNATITWLIKKKEKTDKRCFHPSQSSLQLNKKRQFSQLTQSQKPKNSGSPAGLFLQGKGQTVVQNPKEKICKSLETEVQEGT